MLIAGGRNKGLDLSPMAAEPERLRSVVAIGESAPEISDALRAALHASCEADSMEAAVVAAADSARRGDAVLLSPGCASFDWYPNGGYTARGDHFRRLVAELAGGREGGPMSLTIDSRPRIDARTSVNPARLRSVAERRLAALERLQRSPPVSRAERGAAAAPTSRPWRSARRRSRTT